MTSYEKTLRFFEDNIARNRKERFEVEKDDLAPFFLFTLKWWRDKKQVQVDIELEDEKTRELYLFLKQYFEPSDAQGNG